MTTANLDGHYDTLVIYQTSVSDVSYFRLQAFDRALVLESAAVSSDTSDSICAESDEIECSSRELVAGSHQKWRGC
jgi:hypothetical protein